jgi:hypothetical protein
MPPQSKPRMRLKATVSFEFDLAPIDTYRAEFVVANPRQCARRALEAASREYPGRRWRSVVIVLERLDLAPEPEPLEADAIPADVRTARNGAILAD